MKVIIRYKPRATQEKGTEKKEKKQSRFYGNMLRAAVSAVAVFTVIQPANSSIPSMNFYQTHEVVTIRVTDSARLSEEAKNLSDILKKGMKSNGYTDFTYVDENSIKPILREAERAATALGVPKEIILSHWFLESGGLQGFSKFVMQTKNLGGVYKAHNKVLRGYGTLEQFTNHYIATMQKDGITRTQDLEEITSKLKKGGYFGVSKSKYKRAMLAVLKTLRHVGPKYRKYYQNNADYLLRTDSGLIALNLNGKTE